MNDLSSLVVNAIDIYEAYTISGNTIIANIINDYNATSASITMPVHTNGGAVLTVTVTSAGATLNLVGILSGTGPVTYGGPGIVVLNPAINSPLSGMTSLTLGSLHVWASQNASPITVTKGTLVLANECTVGDVVVSSGVTSFLSFHETAAVLSMHGTCGNLTVGGGSIFQVVTAGPASTQYANVSASVVTLTGGTLTVDTAAYSPAAGAVLTIIHTAIAPTGTFAGLAEGALVTSSTVATDTFHISYLGGSGHDVTLTRTGGSSTAGTASGTSSGSTATTGTSGSGTSGSATTSGTATSGTATTTGGSSGGGAIGSHPSSGGGCGVGGGTLALLGMGLIAWRRKTC